MFFRSANIYQNLSIVKKNLRGFVIPNTVKDNFLQKVNLLQDKTNFSTFAIINQVASEYERRNANDFR